MPTQKLYSIELTLDQVNLFGQAIRNRLTSLSTRFGERDIARKEALKAARGKVHSLHTTIASGSEDEPGTVELSDTELVEAMDAVMVEIDRFPDPDNEDAQEQIAILKNVRAELESALAAFTRSPDSGPPPMAGNPSSGPRQPDVKPFS